MILFSYFSMMVNDSICSLIITTIDNGLCHHTLCFSPGQYPFSLMRDSKHTCAACLYYKHQSFHNYNSKLSIKSEGGKVRNVGHIWCCISSSHNAHIWCCIRSSHNAHNPIKMTQSHYCPPTCW